MKEKNWGFIDISICKIKELFVPFFVPFSQFKVFGTDQGC